MAMPVAERQVSRGDIATAVAVLRQRFGERLQTGAEIRRQHANTITWIPNQPPDAVIWVESTDEVRQVVEIARTHGVPIVPFGAGTSLEGHINAPHGGLSLDFARMNRILAVNERDLDCVVEPGVSRKRLNDYLRDMGLFFPIDPGAEEATIGGMASTRASGTTAVRYGTMRENVLNVTAVMADGSVVKTAQRARKSAAGYDLTRLMVGSEGTLGVITEATLRIHPLPPALGDPVLIRQVCINLLANAIKFTAHAVSAHIEVGAGGESGRDGEQRDKATSVYYVKDNGAGFDMRYYDKLFGIFHRLHRDDEFPGTGVGLAIVQRVVTRHGGRVWAEGKVNQGAAFYFELPVGINTPMDITQQPPAKAGGLGLRTESPDTRRLNDAS